MTTTPEEFESLEALKKEHRKVLQRLSKQDAEKINLEQTITTAAKAAFTSMSLPEAPKTDIRLQKKQTPEVAVALTADWQLGKITPSYNSKRCEDRIQQFAYYINLLTDIQRSEHPVNRIHLWTLGDLVEGERIFPGQEYLIDSGLVDQVVGNGTRIFRDLIWSLLGHFNQVHVPAVPGNHGRVGGLKSNVFHPGTNMDRMLYLVTKQWFDALEWSGMLDKGRLTWDIPMFEDGERGFYTVDKIGKYSSLLVHGEQFRGGNGISGLPYPNMNKMVLKWRDLALDGQIPTFLEVACGHWHQHADIPIGTTRLRIAGSPESGNQFGKEVFGSMQRPSQRLMFVHPNRGWVTNEYKVILT